MFCLFIQCLGKGGALAQKPDNRIWVLNGLRRGAKRGKAKERSHRKQTRGCLSFCPWVLLATCLAAWHVALYRAKNAPGQALAATPPPAACAPGSLVTGHPAARGGLGGRRLSALFKESQVWSARLGYSVFPGPRDAPIGSSPRICPLTFVPVTTLKQKINLSER